MQALSIEENQYGTYSVEICTTLQTLVAVMLEQEKWQEAEEMMAKEVAIIERIHGTYSLSAATALLRLAELLTNNGKREAAEPVYRRVLSIYRSVYGPDTNSVLSFQRKLEALYPSGAAIGELFGIDTRQLQATTEPNLNAYLAKQQ